MLWLRKLAAVLAIAFGLSMLFLPFPDGLTGEREQEVVWLEVSAAPLTPGDARARFGGAFAVIGYDDLEGHDELREALLSLMGRSGGRCVPSDQWHDVIGRFAGGDGAGAGYAFEEGLYRIAAAERSDDGPGSGQVCFEVELLGVWEHPGLEPLTRLSVADLEPYPAVAAAVARATAGEVPAELRVGVEPRELRSFHRRVLDDRGFTPEFVLGQHLLRGGVATEPVGWNLETPWLPAAGRVIGTVALPVGLVLLAGGYRVAASRGGISVAPTGFAVFCDLILVAGAVFAVGLALDGAWVGLAGQPSLLGLEPEWPSEQDFTALHFVALPALFVALPLLTLFFTSLSSQRVRVDAVGVTAHGAIGSTSIRWEEVEAVRLREQRNPASFTVVDFRSLQRVLELKGGDRTVTINEPSSRRRKRAIVEALRNHAPPEKAALVDAVEEW